MWFLSVTGRNEWASQLAYTNNTSFFYPSVGLSALFLNGAAAGMVLFPEGERFLFTGGQPD